MGGNVKRPLPALQRARPIQDDSSDDDVPLATKLIKKKGCGKGKAITKRWRPNFKVADKLDWSWLKPISKKKTK
jgi:hypothetical protein